jgi:prepilin-type N-terminal cleavage/methylation domain-containing protein
MKGTEPRSGGYTLIELAIAVAIIGILAAIGLPIYLSQADKAKDTEAQATLRNALLVEELYHLDNGVYTQNRNQLDVYDNVIRWNVAGNPEGTVRARVRAAQAEHEVCLFSYSASGALFAVYHTMAETRYGRPSQVTACNPNQARTWSTDGW